MENKLKTVDAETLLSTPMSKTMFIVDNLIPQGVDVISGASKIGKSWLMLWLGLQVAQGLPVWGLTTQQCDVLYLSLEDTQRRIKDRLYNLTDTAPSNLYFAVMCGLIGGGLEEQIIDFLSDHPKTKLVIIDTLQKVRDTKGGAGKTGMYGNDYDDISSIKKIADEYNIAVLLVHHLRKLKDSDDPFNEVSGSTGIIGAADTNYVFKRKRSTNAATLLVSGRDMEYQELTLQFNNLVWELVERKNSEDIHKAELPKFLFRVVDFMESRAEWVGTATELLTEMKETETTPNVVTKYLGQFSCEVLEPVGIEYRTKRTGKSRLMQVKEAQELNKKVCGNCYNYEYDGFVFVDEMGERMKMNYLTSAFPKFLERHGLRRMRFHDLRHSCASLLLANGVPLKHIQEWLGHSDFTTTANIYAHLDYSSKITSAQAMETGLELPESGDFGSRWENGETQI